VGVEVRLKPAIRGKLQWSRARQCDAWFNNFKGTVFEVFGICWTNDNLQLFKISNYDIRPGHTRCHPIFQRSGLSRGFLEHGFAWGIHISRSLVKNFPGDEGKWEGRVRVFHVLSCLWSSWKLEMWKAREWLAVGKIFLRKNPWKNVLLNVR
jgi:hypothetical protein